MVVDLLHFHRSRCKLEEFDSMPREWFNYVHLCDTYKEIPEEEEALVHTGRAERLYPGEGEIDIAGVLKKLPGVSRGIEAVSYTHLMTPQPFLAAAMALMVPEIPPPTTRCV